MQYRHSVEFVYKDKRLRNAIPMAAPDGQGMKMFASANPKLTKILSKKKKNALAASSPVQAAGDENNLAKMFAAARSKKRQEELQQVNQVVANKESYISQARRRGVHNLLQHAI